MDVSVIGVPIMYGCDIQGVQYGPAKLRENEMVEIIEEYKENVYDLGDIHVAKVPESNKYDHHKNIKYFKQVVDTNRNLAHAVYSALSAKSFPFVVGGDHSLGLGSIAGASKHFENLAVIWVDAHADINIPESSPSGNFHGMPLAAAMGVGDPATVDLYFDGVKVKPENVYIFGARDLDKGEVKLAADLKLNLYTMDNIRETGLEESIADVIAKVKSSNVDGVHLSFDIDVLDESLVPGTGTPVAKGFDMDEAKKILKEFLGTGFVDSMDFVELNPYLDKEGITTNNCIELVDWTFKVLR